MRLLSVHTLRAPVAILLLVGSLVAAEKSYALAVSLFHLRSLKATLVGSPAKHSYSRSAIIEPGQFEVLASAEPDPEITRQILFVYAPSEASSTQLKRWIEALVANEAIDRTAIWLVADAIHTEQMTELRNARTRYRILRINDKRRFTLRSGITADPSTFVVSPTGDITALVVGAVPTAADAASIISSGLHRIRRPSVASIYRYAAARRILTDATPQ
jgi:hypothetical protein